jgi:hypothetical protein
MTVEQLIEQIQNVSYTWQTSTSKLDNIYKIINQYQNENIKEADNQ